jgi:hypothetical protein
MNPPDRFQVMTRFFRGFPDHAGKSNRHDVANVMLVERRGGQQNKPPAGVRISKARVSQLQKATDYVAAVSIGRKGSTDYGLSLSRGKRAEPRGKVPSAGGLPTPAAAARMAR